VPQAARIKDVRNSSEIFLIRDQTLRHMGKVPAQLWLS